MEQVLSLSAIRSQKATLNRAILDAQTQIADLEVAERIVRRFGEATAESRPDNEAMDDLLRHAKLETGQSKVLEVMSERSLTSRALIQSVLRQCSDRWMTANEIQERASAIKGQGVPMATISPTLSNMKNEGLIVRDGLKVALADRLDENGLQSGSPPRSPETAQPAQ